MNWKEIAKFISGAAAVEIINHTSLAISTILPHTFSFYFFEVYISRTTNSLILIGWMIVFGASTYYAWIKK